jgi:hypothetical protein
MSKAKKRKVFVVAKGAHDFSAAEKFGELRFLSTSLIQLGSASSIHREFSRILARESSPDDYILVSGLSLMNGLAFAIFYSLHGRLNLLIYNKRLDEYDERTLVWDDLRSEYDDAVIGSATAT